MICSLHLRLHGDRFFITLALPLLVRAPHIITHSPWPSPFPHTKFQLFGLFRHLAEQCIDEILHDWVQRIRNKSVHRLQSGRIGCLLIARLCSEHGSTDPRVRCHGVVTARLRLGISNCWLTDFWNCLLSGTRSRGFSILGACSDSFFAICTRKRASLDDKYTWNTV